MKKNKEIQELFNPFVKFIQFSFLDYACYNIH